MPALPLNEWMGYLFIFVFSQLNFIVIELCLKFDVVQTITFYSWAG